MNSLRVPIRKMHCRSCEMLIEKALLKVPGIKKVEASTRRHEAVISYEKAPDMKEIEAAVVEAGYEIGEEEGKKWVTTDSQEYGYLAIGAVALLVVWFLYTQSGISVSFGATSGVNIFTSLIIGLTAGISTCMALIGGLTLGMAARHAERHPEASAAQRFRPHLFFNLGRIGGFFVLGGLLGLLGGFFAPGNYTLAAITIVVAVFMFLLGLQLTEIFPRISNVKLTLPPALAKLLGLHERHAKEYSHQSAVLAGVLTFFLPCGFTQLMQMNAIASAGFWPGALIMAAFAAGTAPGLLGIGGLTSLVRGTFAKIFFKTAGLAVIAFAVFNFANGYRLAGFEPFWEVAPPVAEKPQETPMVLEDGMQVINMTQLAGGYKPNEFTIKKGVPVKWVIDSETSRSCAASLVVPAYGIQEYLNEGKNVIEFTPDKTGVVRFSCSMGMYTGKFNVVE